MTVDETPSEGSSTRPLEWRRLLVDITIVAGLIWAGTHMYLVLNEVSYSTSSMEFKANQDQCLEKLAGGRKGYTLFSEQAFYYSYYADLVAADDYLEALYGFTRDRTAEYPNTINAIHRFNIYPEVLLALGYRAFGQYAYSDPFDFMLLCACTTVGLLAAGMFVLARSLAGSAAAGIAAAAMLLLNFFEVSRVQAHPELRETWALPFLWAECSILVSILRLPRPSVSQFILLGVSAMLFMLFWQFGQFPLLIQSFALYLVHLVGAVDSKKIPKRCSFSRKKALMIVAQPQALRISTEIMPFQLLHIYFVLIASTIATALLMFGNEMMLASMLLSFLVSAVALIQVGVINPVMRTIALFCLLFATKALSAVCTLFAVDFEYDVTNRLPSLVSFVDKVPLQHALIINFQGAVCFPPPQYALGWEDDAHIFHILRAHLTGYEDFVTLQYLCGQAYNLLPRWALDNLITTLVLPLGVLVLALLAVKTCVDWHDGAHADPAVTFWFAQACGFLLLGLLMLRMLPFFTPTLIVSASLLFAQHAYTLFPRRFASPPKVKDEDNQTVSERQSGKSKKNAAKHVAKPNQLAGLLWMLQYCWWAILGIAVVTAPLARWRGFFYSNPRSPFTEDKEQVVAWIKTNTPVDAVITGSMDWSSHVKLQTKRPITVHPHAEKPEMRRRYELQYSIYARMEEKHVAAALKTLKTDYALITLCSAGCSNGKGYDYVASKPWAKYINSARPKFCEVALQHPKNLSMFDVVFRSPQYNTAILVLKDNPRTKGRHENIS